MNIEGLEQEAIVQATQTKLMDDSSDSILENEEVIDTSLSPLPQRAGPRPKTTVAIPHQQIGVEAVPDLNASLHHWVSPLSDVEMQNSIASLPEATGIGL